MQVPNAHQAFIPREKLTDYLLSENHPVGKSKARFFRSLGFDEMNVDLLDQGLRAIALVEQVTEEESTIHGVKYTVAGSLAGPSGATARVRTSGSSQLV